MNKVTFLFFLLSSLAVISTHGQKKLYAKSLNLRPMVVTVATNNFDGGKPFTPGGNFIANLSLVTSKSYHNLLYGFNNNMIRSVNGLLLPKEWDVYVAMGKIIDSKEGYYAIGIERWFQAGKMNIFPFVEGGMSFNHKGFLSVGMIMNVSFILWKRE